MGIYFFPACSPNVSPQLLKLWLSPSEITLKDGNYELLPAVDYFGEEPIDCLHCTSLSCGL